MTAAALLLLPVLATSTVTAIRIEAEGDGPVVRVTVAGPRPPARVEREDAALVLLLPGARAQAGLVVPLAVAEIQRLALEESAEGLRLRMSIDGPFEFALAEDEDEVSVALGPAKVVVSRRPEDVRDLYRRILPAPAPALPPGSAATEAEPVARDPAAEETHGLQFGVLRVTPSVILSYLDADNAFLATAQPIREQYFQVEPGLAVGVGSPTTQRGYFTASYTPRFRTRSEFEQLRRPTHLANVTTDVPIGAVLTARVRYHFAQGLLETTEVDPGREYFFGLAPFVRHDGSAAIVASPGGLLSYEVAVHRNSLRVEEDSQFFDYRIESILGGVNYQFGEVSRAFVRYEWNRLPAPRERPLARSEGSIFSIGASGHLAPLVSGDVLFGWRTLDAPLAGEGGTRFRGAVADVNLRKEFTPGTSVTVTARRGTHPSAFANNAFYVATGGGLVADVALPLGVVFHGAVGLQKNAYEAVAVPRRDDIVGWTVGVGRALTRRAFVRADYRQDRRTSTLSEFDYDGRTFVVAIGIGYLSALAPELAAR